MNTSVRRPCCFAYASETSTAAGRGYDVSPDGKRFLLVKDAGSATQPSNAASIVVVRNWIEELKKLVPRP